MIRILRRATDPLFDQLELRWHSDSSRRFVGSTLAATFLATLVVIELNRQGFLPADVGSYLPSNHFQAIHFAFTLLLLFEVVALVFSLVQSVANSVGRQFEVLSLILLRRAFEELDTADAAHWTEVSDSLLRMLSDAGGALVIFAGLGFYYRLQRHQAITDDAQEQSTFIAIKKVIALLLLVIFFLVGSRDLWLFLTGRETYPFFPAFYTILIFSDILIVFISLRYSSTYRVVFRNSGFAVTTVLLRLALGAPSYYNSLIGLAAILFAIGLTASYNFLAPASEDQERARPAVE